MDRGVTARRACHIACISSAAPYQEPAPDRDAQRSLLSAAPGRRSTSIVTSRASMPTRVAEYALEIMD